MRLSLKHKKGNILKLTLLLVGLITSSSMAKSPKVIYGEDNRVEIGDSRFAHYAPSIAGLFSKKDFDKSSLKTDTPTISRYRDLTYYRSYETCDETAFRNQPTAATCTGFLVGNDILATAGHCVIQYGLDIKNEVNSNCRDAKWVFNYNVNSEENGKLQFEKDQVYDCAKIIRAQYNGDGDFALIKLDRARNNARPLKLNSQKSNYQKGADIFVIGHPTGLPQKFADGAKVQSNIYDHEFNADLDTFGGNSGSPVFNDAGDVIGILVSGETDYRVDNRRQCIVVNTCTGFLGSCEDNRSRTVRGESSTKIWMVQKALGKDYIK